MTKKEKQEKTDDFVDEIKSWIHATGLEHWTIGAEFGGAHEDTLDEQGAAAASKVYPNYNTAMLLFREDWPTWTDRFRSDTIVHELMHLHLHQLHMLLKKAAERYGPEAREVFEDRVNHELEQAVDALTKAFIEHIKES